MDVLSHMAHSCDATHLVNHTLTPALKLYVDHTRASLLLWGSTHPGRVQGLGPETKSKGYFILGQQNSPDSRKKKKPKNIFSSSFLGSKSIQGHTYALKYSLFFFSSSLRRLMTRRRLTRRRSALNPEPNMMNSFYEKRGEDHWHQ